MDPGFHRGDDKDWMPAPDRVRGKLCAGMTDFHLAESMP
jgi:hypothetical protein